MPPQIECDSCNFTSVSEHEDLIHIALSHSYCFKCNFCSNVFDTQAAVVSHAITNHLNKTSEPDQNREKENQNSFEKEPEDLGQTQQKYLEPDPNVDSEVKMEEAGNEMESNDGKTQENKKRRRKQRPVSNLKEAVRCDHCNYVCASLPYLKIHINAEHTNIRFPCTMCPESFKYGGALSKHINAVHKDEPFEELTLADMDVSPDEEDLSKPRKKSEKASNANVSRQRLPGAKPTMPYDPNGAFNCDECQFTFITLRNLRNHLQSKHGNRKYQCPKCHRCFPARATASSHINNEVCGPGRLEDLGLALSELLVTVTEDGDVQPVVPEITVKEQSETDDAKSKSLAPSEKVDGFKFSIVEEKEQKCEFCDLTFVHKVERLKHVKAAHTDPSDPDTYVCSTCSKKFRTINLLRSHFRSEIHTNNKEFQCEMCAKLFARQSNLTKHVNVVHKGLRNFKCPECDYRGSSRKEIRSHYEPVHLGKRDHECPYCHAKLSRQDHLRRHMKTTCSKIPITADISTPLVSLAPQQSATSTYQIQMEVPSSASTIQVLEEQAGVHETQTEIQFIV